MIHFFTTDHHRYTVEDFLDSWMPDGRSRVRVVSYEKWSVWQPFDRGVCIFTDLERLLPFEMPMAVDLSSALLAHPEQFTVLNAPGNYSGRFNLLKKLFTAGINRYNATRIGDDYSTLRFPVFVRNEKDHKGPITGLLNSRAELDAAVQQLKKTRIDYEHLIVIEYCHSADPDGFFRKYSAVKIAGKLVPRHLFYSKEWSTKNSDIVDEPSLREEEAFIEKFPHHDQVQEAFRIAGVDYGRIDYGFSEGQLQVWEINTNPVIVPQREKIDPRRLKSQSDSAAQIAQALEDLSLLHAPSEEYPFRTALFICHQFELFFSRAYRQIKYGRRA